MESTSSGTASSPTLRLAGHVAAWSWEALDRRAVEAAKRHLLDTVACIVGAAPLTPATPVREMHARHGGAPEARALGTAVCLPSPAAAYVNGHAANLLDFDDGERGYGHPGPATIPAALAIAERDDLGGRDLLAAIVVGYEVSQRLGRYCRPSPGRAAEVWGQATWQGLGGVAATAHLLGLDADAVATALGIAAATAAVPSSRRSGMAPDDGSMVWLKNGYGPSGARAIEACLLAEAGCVGNRTIFDGEHGFWLMSGSDRRDEAALVDGLGEADPLILGCGLKPYACCLWAHTTLEAIGALRARGAIDPAAVAKVTIAGYGELLTTLGGAAPTNVIDAQFHLPHLAALALAGRPPVDGLTERDLDDAAIARLRDLVVVAVDPESERRFQAEAVFPVRVTIQLSDGTVLEERAERPWGTPGGRPFSPADARAKATNLMAPVLGPERAQRLIEAIDQGEKTSTRELVALAAPEPAQPARILPRR